MSGHTRGTWYVKQYPDGIWGVRNELFAIANMVENGDEDEADARLIASAPKTKRDRDELLAAAKMALIIITDPLPGLTSKKWFVEKLKAAIARAEGSEAATP